MSKVFSSNFIKFEDNEKGIRSVLQIESYKPMDIVIKITPSEGYYVTTERLNWYKTKVKNYLANPDVLNIIVKPIVKSSQVVETTINMTLTEFESYVLIPYACTEYQISTDDVFNNIVKTEVLHGMMKHNELSIDLQDLPANTSYYIRARYGGGGYSSEWSDVVNFTTLKPTIDKPSVESVSFTYQKSAPYLTTIVATSSASSIPDHTYTTWKIYNKTETGSYNLVYSVIKSDISLRNISIAGQYPNNLQYHKDYYITVTYYDASTGFSRESDYFKFCSTGVTLTTPNDITFFPWPVNVSNPMLSFDSFLSLTVDGQEQIININELEGVYWEVKENKADSRTQKFTSQTNAIQLPFGTLKENTEYQLSVYYRHTYLGFSGIKNFTFKTNKEFINHPDGLRMPLKIYNDTAYYGEIAKTSLMNENITYRGVYSSTKSYKRYDEVSKDGKLYICINDTPPGSNYTFSTYFETPRENNAEVMYGSQLPTAKWLLKNIGLYHSLNTTNVANGATDIINEDTTWLKLQNKHKQTLYITKLPILSNVSVNDLIRKDLFHPRRKTVRIGEYLYYVRILVNELEPGYDVIDPIYKDKEYNYRVSQLDKIQYNEGDLFSSLLNGNLAQFESTDLDIDLVSYRELIYNTDSIYGYKIDPSANMRLTSKELQSADTRIISYRPVLELIPEENKPIYHISDRIPGDNDISKYDPFVDSCYLGYVDVSDFVDSEDIDLRTGLNSFSSVQNKGWYKFYYRGMIYYMSNGTNFNRLSYNDINNNNLLTPTPLYATGVLSDDIKLGKIIYNNVIFNVMCPSVLTYTTCRTLTKVGNRYYNIFNTADSNIDLNISYDCFLSDVVYGILDEQYPNKSLSGYKGSYKEHEYVSTITQIGSGTNDDDVFLSSDVVCELTNVSGVITSTYTPVLNYQKQPYRIKSGDVDAPVDVVLCLTVNPIIDKIELWKEKEN